MKNKIKKILLLGMTAMFTAGAAGTAVISCPVWADEAEQNSETAEEPKAEDAAVEEKIADQTDDKTENTDLKTVEHPRMSAYSIRRFSIVKDGEEVFQIKQEPADYKMDFDYWEITNPYDETATVKRICMKCLECWLLLISATASMQQIQIPDWIIQRHILQ